ncbi:MAG TPA: hypothetical protein VLA56_21210 [Pseudomonadales bacterium]|nr:hypothetical protein [Pseudomonadales bacterium]
MKGPTIAQKRAAAARSGRSAGQVRRRQRAARLDRLRGKCAEMTAGEASALLKVNENTVRNYARVLDERFKPAPRKRATPDKVNATASKAARTWVGDGVPDRFALDHVSRPWGSSS